MPKLTEGLIHSPVSLSSSSSSTTNCSMSTSDSWTVDRVNFFHNYIRTIIRSYFLFYSHQIVNAQKVKFWFQINQKVIQSN